MMVNLIAVNVLGEAGIFLGINSAPASGDLLVPAGYFLCNSTAEHPKAISQAAD